MVGFSLVEYWFIIPLPAATGTGMVRVMGLWNLRLQEMSHYQLTEIYNLKKNSLRFDLKSRNIKAHKKNDFEFVLFENDFHINRKTYNLFPNK